MACSCFQKLKDLLPGKRAPPPDTRRVYVGGQRVDDQVEVVAPAEQFASNRVVSSKYTVITFLPKNLFEQFHRIANFYFLIVAIIQILVPTPVSALTTVTPLIFVVVVTAIKQGYEDWLRHKSDDEVNKRISNVVKEGKLQVTTAMDIKVGDIIKVERNMEIPCDLVMLSSEDPDGTCFITTANLDGETNLKAFYSPSATKHLQNEEDFENFRAVIECEQPIPDLYRFTGRLSVRQGGEVVETVPLGPENVLLRGVRLKNTQFVYGCTIYTGQETKISLNSKLNTHKYSRVEKTMNVYLIIYLIFLVVFAAVWEMITLLVYLAPDMQYSSLWYVGFLKDFSTMNSWQQFVAVVEEFLSYTILMNYIIPISMYVTVELQKFVGSMFFEWDVDMYDEQCNEPAKAVTSDLNEELGQIQYLFTDKTGTLTENEMKFRQCSVGGAVYELVGEELCLRSDVPGVPPAPLTGKPPAEVETLLLVLSLCHTVRVDLLPSLSPGSYSSLGLEYEYQSSSPDEKALVEAAARLGTVYDGVRNNRLEVTCHGVRKQFMLHQVLDFDPTRKKMSVIVEDLQDGEIWLLCKGAETALFETIISGDVETIEGHVNDFAVLGLRTLVIGRRQLSRAEFEQYDSLLKSARNVLQDREEKLAEAFAVIEKDLTLVGATAVEDKLQEGVPETIRALTDAGIKVWVLTGDKEETAVNISYSAGHFHHSMLPLSLTKQISPDECGATLDNFLQQLEDTERRNEASKYALVIDGKSLFFALDAHHDLLRTVCMKCITVLCCRMSPIQKALVVRLIKDSKLKPTTAAIGDGANDVSMIQEAHVGLGIMGKEGRQAVRASDYAFGKFRFIKRALLMHGHYFYVRIAILVQYFFYKNVAMITAELYFTFFSAFSQQSIFSGFFLMWYNITFTALPILLYGWFELDAPMNVLLNNPPIYRSLRNNRLLSYENFLIWNLLGLWQSFVFFFGTYFALSPGNSPFGNGWEYGVYDMGLIIMTGCVLVVNIKLMLVSYYFSWIIVAGFVVTIGGYFLLTFICCSLLWPFLSETILMYGSMQNMFNSAYVWWVLIMITVVALIPDILLRAVEDNYGPLYPYRTSASKIQRIFAGSTDDLLTSGTDLQQDSQRGSISTISDTHHKYQSNRRPPFTSTQPNNGISNGIPKGVIRNGISNGISTHDDYSELDDPITVQIESHGIRFLGYDNQSFVDDSGETDGDLGLGTRDFSTREFTRISHMDSGMDVFSSGSRDYISDTPRQRSQPTTVPVSPVKQISMVSDSSAGSNFSVPPTLFRQNANVSKQMSMHGGPLEEAETEV